MNRDITTWINEFGLRKHIFPASGYQWELDNILYDDFSNKGLIPYRRIGSEMIEGYSVLEGTDWEKINKDDRDRICQSSSTIGSKGRYLIEDSNNRSYLKPIVDNEEVIGYEIYEMIGSMILR